MEYFKFIVSKENQNFVSIIKVIDNQMTGANVELYSTLISDEQTARGNFTLTGHLPSEEFESLIKEAKEI
tara:strand:+ start:4964 stop:5173 length:210 start_codon:yes stop_codon:yes gene_type:complete